MKDQEDREVDLQETEQEEKEEVTLECRVPNGEDEKAALKLKKSGKLTPVDRVDLQRQKGATTANFTNDNTIIMDDDASCISLPQPLPTPTPRPNQQSEPGAFAVMGLLGLASPAISSPAVPVPVLLPQPAEEEKVGNENDEPQGQDQQQRLNEGLVQARPVEDLEAGRQELPHAEEHDETKNFIHRFQSRSLLLLIFGLAAVALVVSLTVVFTQSPATDETLRVVTSTPPTSAPTPMSIKSHVLSLLPEYSLQAIEESLTSPQSLALQWLLDDPHLKDSNNTGTSSHLDLYYSDYRIQVRLSLATLYFATDGPNWFGKDGWLDYNVHECDWEVRKSTFDGAIRQDEPPIPISCETENSTTIGASSSLFYRNLWLDTNGLVGSIPMELYAITTLRTISFMGNRDLRGTLPSSPALPSTTVWNDMTDLFELSIAGTRLSGSLPTQLGLLTSNLGFLILANNQLTGPIPSELGELGETLKRLALAGNAFTGTLPLELAHLSNMELLVLGYNELTGIIPPPICSLPNIMVSYDCAALLCGCHCNCSSTASMQFSNHTT